MKKMKKILSIALIMVLSLTIGSELLNAERNENTAMQTAMIIESANIEKQEENYYDEAEKTPEYDVEEVEGNDSQDAVETPNVVKPGASTSGIEAYSTGSYFDATTGITFQYDTVTQEATITNYNSNVTGTTNLVIPSNIVISGTTYKIVAIDNHAFDVFNNPSATKLVSVQIPNTITSIGAFAFFGNQLTFVDIPDSVTYMGAGTFEANSLTQVKLSNSLTRIETEIFAHNRLTSVTIPSSVTSIGNNAFHDNALTFVYIPSSVTHFGEEGNIDYTHGIFGGGSTYYGDNEQFLSLFVTNEGNATNLKNLFEQFGVIDTRDGFADQVYIAETFEPTYASGVNLNNVVSLGNNLSFKAIPNYEYVFDLSVFPEHEAGIGSYLKATEVENQVQWYHNDTALIGQTNLTLQLNNIQEANAGTYYAIVDGQRLADITVTVDGDIDTDEDKDVDTSNNNNDDKAVVNNENADGLPITGSDMLSLLALILIAVAASGGALWYVKRKQSKNL